MEINKPEVIDENEKVVKLHKFSSRKFDDEMSKILSGYARYENMIENKINRRGK